MTLLNAEFVSSKLTHEALYLQGHGANGDYLGGGGLMYYTIVYALKAEICVCLGSGGGFVPRIMRQAQLDLGLKNAQTILIDDGSGRWGHTIVHDRTSFFCKEYPDIKVLKINTDVAFIRLVDMKLDYVHVDANHSYPFVRSDFDNYKRLLKDTGVMTFHDTKTQCGVPQLIKEIRADPDWDVVNFPDIGCGFALVRRKQ